MTNTDRIAASHRGSHNLGKRPIITALSFALIFLASTICLEERGHSRLQDTGFLVGLSLLVIMFIELTRLHRKRGMMALSSAWALWLSIALISLRSRLQPGWRVALIPVLVFNLIVVLALAIDN